MAAKKLYHKKNKPTRRKREMSNDLLFHFLQVQENTSSMSKPASESPPVTDESGFSIKELNHINEGILEQLQQVISDNKFKTYFHKNLVLSQLGIEHIIFTLPTEFMKNIISDQFMNELDNAILNVLGKKYVIELQVSAPAHKSLSSNQSSILRNNNPSEPPAPRSAKDASFTLDLNNKSEDIQDKVDSLVIKETRPNNYVIVDNTKTFDNFIFGPSNQMAYNACKAVALNPGKKYSSIFLYSDSGLGKTHLLHAVANDIYSRYPTLNVQLVSAKDLISEMLNAIRFQKMDEIHTKYSRHLDVLMIDDIQILRKTEGIQDQFFHLFNELHNQKKQLIFTADKNPKDIEGIEERIKTRLQWGLVVDIQKPDLETRIAILKRKAQDLDLFLTEDILTLIATHINNSIRELEGAIVKISACSELMSMEVDCEMVKDILKLDTYRVKKDVSIEDIARASATFFEVSLADLKSKSRDQRYTHPRHIAMYLAYEKYSNTFKEIGNFFNRDHSSVVSAVEKIRGLLKTNSQITKDINSIEERLD